MFHQKIISIVQDKIKNNVHVTFAPPAAAAAAAAADN